MSYVFGQEVANFHCNKTRNIFFSQLNYTLISSRFRDKLKKKIHSFNYNGANNEKKIPNERKRKLF